MTDSAVRPFEVHVPVDLAGLRRRIAATRWPPRETVTDRSQGVQSSAIQNLVTYWGTGYDWRRCEAKLNALPQFTTEIDGLDIHFIHVKSDHQDALPLIITHGWPGSVIETLGVIARLIDPTSHGGAAGDAFHLVIPSLPGYGFSDQPALAGWDPGRVARAWATLMNRLGYTRYVAQGGDIGAAVTDAVAIQAPDGLAGIHLNFLRRPPLEVAAAILDNITLYWLTNTAAPAARMYWESARSAAAAAGHASPQVSLPVAFTVFSGEIFQAREAGPRRSTPTSSTSTRPSGAATSPRGRNRTCSPPRSGPRSGHCANGRSS